MNTGAATFDLSIEFVGLCLFVPDPDGKVTGTPAMYVLLPAQMPVNTQPPVPEHVVGVCVQEAYLQPGSQNPDTPWQIYLPESVVATFGVTGKTLHQTLPSTLANVGRAANRPIATAAWGTDPGNLLAARFTLTSGECSSYESGGSWEYPGERTGAFTYSVTWTVKGIVGDHFDLALAPFGGGAGTSLTLYPIENDQGQSQIQVSIYHTPADELPNGRITEVPPRHGTPAYHFGAFYSLFEPPVLNMPIPRWNGDEQGGSPFTCLSGGSELTP